MCLKIMYTPQLFGVIISLCIYFYQAKMLCCSNLLHPYWCSVCLVCELLRGRVTISYSACVFDSFCSSAIICFIWFASETDCGETCSVPERRGLSGKDQNHKVLEGSREELSLGSIQSVRGKGQGQGIIKEFQQYRLSSDLINCRGG